jgi:tetratricopeptide (TPR) repeat protein
MNDTFQLHGKPGDNRWSTVDYGNQCNIKDSSSTSNRSNIKDLGNSLGSLLTDEAEIKTPSVSVSDYSRKPPSKNRWSTAYDRNEYNTKDSSSKSNRSNIKDLGNSLRSPLTDIAEIKTSSVSVSDDSRKPPNKPYVSPYFNTELELDAKSEVQSSTARKAQQRHKPSETREGNRETDMNEVKILLRRAEKYRTQKKYSLAEGIGEDLVHLCRQSLGHNHLETIKVLEALSAIYREQGKYQEAIKTLKYLAEIYVEQGKPEEVEGIYDQIFDLRSQAREKEADSPQSVEESNAKSEPGQSSGSEDESEYESEESVSQGEEDDNDTCQCSECSPPSESDDPDPVLSFGLTSMWC